MPRRPTARKKPKKPGKSRGRRLRVPFWPNAARRRRWWRAFRRASGPAQVIAALVICAFVWLAANWVYQVSRKPTELCYRLPSIEELDTINYKIIVFGFPVLTVGIIMGGIWAYNAWGRFWGWDAKETWALITALIYAGYLHMRFVKNLRGRKAVYVSMLGFASVVFTFLGVNYLSELHGYLSGRG